MPIGGALEVLWKVVSYKESTGSCQGSLPKSYLQADFLLKGLGDTDCPTTNPRWPAGREEVLPHLLV
jgi:hypothetical protein